ncbi:MAG: SDR family oxidoreductase [Lachnospiraceae bacterium]|nr:SDR family oxidoreductase [Agathobacter sp.]MDD6290755.1 SDR family oxidoreductase [Lachnospiraceae bacterium]
MKHSYAVITGASSGIGAAFARCLAREGYPLVLVARRRERLEQLAQELKQAGVESVVFVADLSQKEECYRLMEELSSKTLGVFINDAGFGDCGCFLETDVEKELEMIDVNVKAMHLLSKLVLRKMEKQNGGYLLNVVSSAGLIPAGPYMATYYATKSYMLSLTRAVAQELKERKSSVYIGALCPGPVDTEFNSVANVEFALHGITPEYCAEYAVRQMRKRRVLIVPTMTMKAATTFGRLIPQSLYIRLTGHQQKKKLGTK